MKETKICSRLLKQSVFAFYSSEGLEFLGFNNIGGTNRQISNEPFYSFHVENCINLSVVSRLTK
jgi:hypothetical protein